MIPFLQPHYITTNHIFALSTACGSLSLCYGVFHGSGFEDTASRYGE